MKRQKYLPIITLLMGMQVPVVYAGGSVEHSAKALEMSVQAVGNATLAGLKLVSGAAAVPLTFAGAVGKVSGDIGDELWEEANTTETDAFPVSDEVVTAGPGPAPDVQIDKEGQ